jgi:hypothetical protein
MEKQKNIYLVCSSEKQKVVIQCNTLCILPTAHLVREIDPCN